MERKTAIILAAAIVALAAIAAVAAVSMQDDDDRGFSPSDYPACLTVLGNVDLDTDIDERDVSLIRAMADSGVQHEYRDIYMYDANFDGVVDGSDADLVQAMVDAQLSGDWSAVGTVHYVDVDRRVASYRMDVGDKVITLIAPPLDSVLAMGGKDLVVGFDNRITTGKYHSEYASLFDFSEMYDVGSCAEPSTEQITNASKRYGGVTVVCGTRDSYGPTMESVFAGTDVQVVRVASWEYGETMHGFMTLGFLLKRAAESQEYYDWYNGVDRTVSAIVATADASRLSAGIAAAYGYTDELSLLGTYTGEHACVMSLGFRDSADGYLNGLAGGGHGNTISTEAVTAMYQSESLRWLPLMIGAPFQVKVMSGTGDAESTADNFKSLYRSWGSKIGAGTMPELSICVTGYSFSSGVSEVLNKLILCYWAHNDEFLAYFGCSTQKEAQDVLAGYVDRYCSAIGIDGLWSFYGEANGGSAGTYGMNLLYCGEGDGRNILYGPESGSTDV